MKMKALVLCVSLVLFCGSNGALSSGIPVIDAANIMDNLMQYILMIQEYTELISQTDIEAEQLLQLIEQYTQTLREYQQYLHQIKALRHYMSEKDWLQLLKEIDQYYRYYGKGDMSTIPEMDRQSSTYEGDLDAVLGQYGYTPRDPKEVESEASALGIRSGKMMTDANREWATQQKFKDQMRMVTENEKQREENKKKINVLNMATKNLDDASDLATLHLMALQSQVLLNQVNDLLITQNQQMLLMESQEQLRAARKAEARDRELRRLKEREPFQGGKAIQKWGGY
jgi:hypothetical protein